MRRLFFLLLACLALSAGGCDTMPKEEPGYYVRAGRAGAGERGSAGARAHQGGDTSRRREKAHAPHHSGQGRESLPLRGPLGERTS